jgi:hypothetical protein
MPDQDTTLKVWLGRLSSAQDSATRAECIRGLEVLGHPGALSALGELFATDPDPETRLLAQQAGKSIYYSAVRQAWMSGVSSGNEQQKAAEALARVQANKSGRQSS